MPDVTGWATLLVAYAMVFESQTTRGYETVGGASQHGTAKRKGGVVGRSEYSELHSESTSIEVDRTSVYEPAEDGT